MTKVNTVNFTLKNVDVFLVATLDILQKMAYDEKGSHDLGLSSWSLVKVLAISVVYLFSGEIVD